MPGFGAQGLGAAEVAACFKPGGTGAIVSASRSVIYAYEQPEYKQQFADQWEPAVEKACQDFITPAPHGSGNGLIRRTIYTRQAAITMGDRGLFSFLFAIVASQADLPRAELAPLQLAHCDRAFDGDGEGLGRWFGVRLTRARGTPGVNVVVAPPDMTLKVQVRIPPTPVTPGSLALAT